MRSVINSYYRIRKGVRTNLGLYTEPSNYLINFEYGDFYLNPQNNYITRTASIGISETGPERNAQYRQKMGHCYLHWYWQVVVF